MYTVYISREKNWNKPAVTSTKLQMLQQIVRITQNMRADYDLWLWDYSYLVKLLPHGFTITNVSIINPIHAFTFHLCNLLCHTYKYALQSVAVPNNNGMHLVLYLWKKQLYWQYNNQYLTCIHMSHTWHTVNVLQKYLLERTFVQVFICSQTF